jgi:hypothetical protein
MKFFSSNYPNLGLNPFNKSAIPNPKYCQPVTPFKIGRKPFLPANGTTG